jgi:hypothetical protein
MLIDLESADNCMLFQPAGSEPGEWECCYNWLSCVHDSLNFNPIQEESLARKYVLSITWSSGEVFTTGSPIKPVTLAESYYKLVAQAICGIMYAYLLGALCNVFATKARDSNRYYEDMDELNGVLAIKKVDNVELCTSLRTYFRWVHRTPHSSPTQAYLTHNTALRYAAGSPPQLTGRHGRCAAQVQPHAARQREECDGSRVAVAARQAGVRGALGVDGEG